MAISKKTKKTAVAATAVAVTGSSTYGANYLVRPRLTEKAGVRAEMENAYTFEVSPRATKDGVKKAIVEMYKVTPVKVNIINLPAKEVFSRGRVGRTSGVKKAVIFLKKGDKIEFI